MPKTTPAGWSGKGKLRQRPINSFSATNSKRQPLPAMNASSVVCSSGGDQPAKPSVLNRSSHGTL